MTRTQSFIDSHRHLLTSAPQFYNVDTTQMTPTDYANAKTRILIIFPTPYSVRSFSATDTALLEEVRMHCPDTFIDFAYYPEPDEIKYYNRLNLPYAIGSVTHLDPSHFDLVGFSISVIHEIVTTACIVDSFKHCDSPIPTFWSQRKDLPLHTHPVLFAGGITSAYSDALFGSVMLPRSVETAYLDYLYLGASGLYAQMIERYHTAKGTLQDFTDSLFPLGNIYQPQAYKVTYKNCRIVSNEKLNPLAPDFVTPYYPHDLSDSPPLTHTILKGTGQNVSNATSMVSEGCSGSGACSFCAEGVYTNGFVEKSEDQILSDAHTARKYTAASEYKPFSFNTNYLTDYKGKLLKLLQIYPKVTYINMRMEELGHDPDALRMMKESGAMLLSSPIEGISQRIQNNLLNKHLSQESLTAFFDTARELHFSTLKIGGILTGYEEPQDWEEFYALLRNYSDLHIRLNFTPLLHYPLTPMEFLERKVARNDFNRLSWVTPEVRDALKELKVGYKIHAHDYSALFQQSLVDLGRELTNAIYHTLVESGSPCYTLRALNIQAFVKWLKDYITDDFFTDRPLDYISSCHRIHLPLRNSVRLQAANLLQSKQYGSVFDTAPIPRCLKTSDAKVFCNPGCKRCLTASERQLRLTRDTSSTASFASLLRQPRLRPTHAYRFYCHVDKLYDVLNSDYISHAIISKFLQQDEAIYNSFHSIHGSNQQGQTGISWSGYFYGQFIFDTEWQSDCLDALLSAIPLVNANLKAFSVLRIEEVQLDDLLTPEHYNVFMFESTLPRHYFDDATYNYHHQVLVDSPGLKFTPQLTEDSRLLPPRYFSYSGKVIGVFAIPACYCTSSYMSGFLKGILPISVMGINDKFTFRCICTHHSQPQLAPFLTYIKNNIISK